jgi:hypothetical protein
MPKRTLPTAQVLTLLAETPPRLAHLTEGLTPEDLWTAPAPDVWSAIDVLAHLRACADVWGDCIATMLAEDTPTLRAINPRAWLARTDYREQEFPSSLQVFAAQRAALLAVLEPLPPDGWSRAATVTGAGKPLERTVLDYARPLTEHEQPHIKQIARLMSDVGRRMWDERGGRRPYPLIADS